MYSDEAKIYTALLIAATVLAVILIFFVISLIRQHKKNLQLHKEKIQAEISTLENERKRIASDLHDEIGPVLSSVKLQINSIDVQDIKDQALISNAGKYLDDTLAKIREIANDLMPTALARKGLLVALGEFFEGINLLNKVNIEYNFSVDELSLEKQKQIHLYRIIQEIIHNCIKHSSASRLEFTISESKGLLILQVVDNGVGFDYSKVINENSGLGLKNMLSRIEVLDGVIYLDTAKGKGVEYTIEVPIN